MSRVNDYFKKVAVLQAAINAGKAIIEIYQKNSFEPELKSDNSPLTIADQESHNILEKSLNAQFKLPILSEEGRSISFEERKKWKTYWLIDPLDGTKEFINRNGEFTVNIALIEDNIPVEGIIYVPMSRTLYFGSKSQGAFKIENCPNNLDEVDQVDIVKLPIMTSRDKYVIVSSRSHMSDRILDYVTDAEKQHNNVGLISKGSSLKFCMIAEGKANVYPRFSPTMEWDTAAGDAICRAAGFYVLDYTTKKELRYNKSELLNPPFIVCNSIG